MADKITEKQVIDLIALLRTDTAVETKVAQVNAVKSGIKQHNVPDALVAQLFDVLRTASGSQHAVLVNAGFTALNHLLTRLSLQEPKYLAKEAPRTLPLIIEKLGDQKEKFRTLASSSLVTLYGPAPADVERAVRNTAMVGKNPRAKETALQWLLQMHRENGLQFRNYVPTLMELLEDADGMVRDTAKATVIELFRNAPGPAKVDLKRQLKNFKVRPAIEQAIVKELNPPASAPTPEPDASPVIASARPAFTASVSSLSSERPITPMPDARPDPVEPTYVNTQRELDTIMKDMQPYFEGKESEHNWTKREESITKLRRLLAGNAVSDYHDVLLTGIRSLLDGIIKSIISLRTSLSKEGCSLVQDIAFAYGPGMDPMVELLLQTFIKLSAGTKKISAQLANSCVDAIVGRVTYNSRIMQHIWTACQDKNVQPRLFATGWLKTILNKEAHHKNHVEHTGGLDLIEKSIKKGLLDPNPGVREKMRSTYWTFAGIWPAKAESIMSNLDATAQKLLQNDPNNPNSPKKPEIAARPGLGLSKSTLGPGKPSLRETVVAQRKAVLAAKNLPARPGSAMAHFSPARTVSNSSTLSNSSTTTTASTVRKRPDLATAPNAGGLSVAPMRPTRRRPELAARPATAGPYSVRGHDEPSSENASPPQTIRPRPAVTPKPHVVSPKRTVQRPRQGHVASASESSVPTPSRATFSKTSIPSPRGSAGKTVSGAPRHFEHHSPGVARPQPGLAPAAPIVADLKTMSPKTVLAPATSVQMESVEPDSETTARPLKVFEDPFTEQESTPRSATVITPVLEDRPVNTDVVNLRQPDGDVQQSPPFSPEKTRQNSRLLDSGISKVKAQTLEVHGFRKLQSILRDPKVALPIDKFDALLLGLFDFLKSPLPNLAPEKVQDTKAQVLVTIKLLLKRDRTSFIPYVCTGLECLLAARSAYESKTHIVSGLELLADELAVLGDPSELLLVLTRHLVATNMKDMPGCRELSMGNHVLRRILELHPDFVPRDDETALLAALASRCLESEQSAVRMDAVQMCVTLHGRVGDARFWEAMKGVKEDPKSLITYYIVKRQREAGPANGVIAAS